MNQLVTAHLIYPACISNLNLQLLQLENILDDKNMMAADKSKLYNYQAGNTDYANNRQFDRAFISKLLCLY